MGSDSDWERCMKFASETLAEFGLPHECRVVSAHRTPDWMSEYAGSAAARGLEVIIAGAGGAAHLPGMVAGHTLLPVIGVPVQSQALNGMDSLLSIVQMPAGVPVAYHGHWKSGRRQRGSACHFDSRRRPALICDGNSRSFESRGPSRCWEHVSERRSSAVAQAPRSPLPPGSTIGVFGSGQLGRMLAMEARRMGYRIHTYSPESESPTGQIADLEFAAAYDDCEAVRAFSKGVDALTFEFENVPSLVAEIAAEDGVPVRPSGAILHAAQNRRREKSMLRRAGLPVTPFLFVESVADMEEALQEIGYPAVLKTAAFGYDGKGQTQIESEATLESAWQSLGGKACVLEAHVNFERELSVVAARGANGDFAAYPLVENRHVNHILDVTIAPAEVEPAVAREAERLARQLCEFLGMTGVLCIEFFLLPKPRKGSNVSGIGVGVDRASADK